MFRQWLVVLMAVALVAICPCLANAQTCDKQWTGAVSNLWSNGSNWDPFGMPLAEHNVCHLIGAVTQMDLDSSPLNPAIIASLHVSGVNDGGLIIGTGITDRRGLRISGSLFDPNPSLQDGSYDVTVGAGSLLRVLGDLDSVNVNLEAGTATIPTVTDANNLLTTVTNIIAPNNHSRLHITGDIVHNVGAPGTASLTAGGSDAIVTVDGTITAGDFSLPGVLGFHLLDGAVMNITGSAAPGEIPVIDGDWEVTGSTLTLSNNGSCISIGSGTYHVSEGSTVTVPGAIYFVDAFTISDPSTSVVAGSFMSSGTLSVSNGATLTSSQIEVDFGVVINATVDGVTGGILHGPLPGGGWTIVGPQASVRTNSIFCVENFAVTEGARVVMPVQTNPPPDPFLICAANLLVTAGAVLDAPDAPIASVNRMTVLDGTVDVAEVTLVPGFGTTLGNVGLTVVEGSTVNVRDRVMLDDRTFEYGSGVALIVRGLMRVNGAHARIRKQFPGLPASLALTVAGFEASADLSLPTSSAQSWDTSAVTLTVIQPSDPQMPNVGTVEVMNISWDVDTAEPLIFCDTHTNKWAGLAVKPGVTANLVDAHDNGYLGTLYSSDEVINILGDVTIPPDATLNTNGIKVYYTGVLYNTGVIDDPSNVVHVLALHFGDFNADFVINRYDYVIMTAAYSGSGVPTPDPRCDFDGDNDVDDTDVDQFFVNLQDWGINSLCSPGEGPGGGDGPGGLAPLGPAEQAFIAQTIAWSEDNLSEQTLDQAVEAFDAAAVNTSDPVEAGVMAALADGLAEP